MSNQQRVQKFLAHAGVKGMKWGVRRTDAQLGRSKGEKDDKGKADAPKKEKTTSTKGASSKKSRDSMSDAELKAVVNRLNMEKQFDTLTYKPSSADRVASFLGGVAVNVARQQLSSVANDHASRLVGAQLKKKKADPFKKPPYIPPSFLPPLPKR